MKKFIFLIFVFSFNVFAGEKLSHLSPNLSIYSEYYPNPSAKFKGTIIFENGSGTDLDEWKHNKKFFTCIKQLGSVFLYDRNGLGKSPPDLQLSTTNPLTAKLVSDKLSNLLKQLNINPPYLFVAHSYGVMYASYFILKNPHLVKGLLLIDPVPRNFTFSNKQVDKLKSGIKEAKSKSASYIYKNYGGQKTEVLYQLLGFDESKRSIKLLGNISNAIPIIILSSTGMEKNHPLNEDWYKSQMQWLNKNPSSKIFRVSSGHFIQFEKPETSCNALKKILSLQY